MSETGGGTFLPPGEQGPRRPRGSGSGGPSQGVAAHTTRAARGAGLIALAVILGVVLLQVVDKGNTGPIGDRSAAKHPAATTTTTTAAATPSTTATTAAASPTTAAQTATRPPSQVVVDVLNGSGTSGVAGQLTTQLKSKGYQTITPGDTSHRSGSVVYYRSGFEREATALATLVPNNPKVAAMPSPAPQNADSSANIVVVIGA
jgi:hypothetical protein